MTRIMNTDWHIIYECDYPTCDKRFDTVEEQIHHEVHDHYKALVGLGCYVCDKK